MATRGRSETPEQIAQDLNIADFDNSNDRDRMFIGIISKLRGKNRDLQTTLDQRTAEVEDLQAEVGDFRRTTKESEIINSVLGDKKVIGDQAKFDRWKAKLAQGDSWEDDLKQLVEDFAVDKQDGSENKGGKKTGTTPTQSKPAQGSDEKKGGASNGSKEEENKGGEGEDGGENKGGNKPGHQTRVFRGGSQAMEGTAVRAPRTPSERLRFAQEDPEGYDAWRAEQGR